MILKGARIISPMDNIDGIFDIKIENGIIVEIASDIEGEGIDFTGKLIVSGLVDMHCHLREPGFEHKETIETGIKSALHGGFVAISPMANTNPVIDDVETLQFIIDKAKLCPDIGFYPICAVTVGLGGKELSDVNTLKAAGAVAFSDDGKPLENLKLFKEALMSGELIISHAEDPKLLTDPLSEAVSVARELEVLRDVGGRLHFAHISTKRAIELIRQAKADGLNVTCETAPHYFSFTKENETKSGKFKMNPPLRTQKDKDAVIEGLKDGTIDCIATDHAPHLIEEKLRPFKESPFGIVGFETALGAGLKLVQDGHLTINQLVEKMSANPAKILNLKEQGQIKVGQKANLTVIDADLEYEVKASNFETKSKITPFEGMKFKGKTIATIVNGEITK